MCVFFFDGQERAWCLIVLELLHVSSLLCMKGFQTRKKTLETIGSYSSLFPRKLSTEHVEGFQIRKKSVEAIGCFSFFETRTPPGSGFDFFCNVPW